MDLCPFSENLAKEECPRTGLAMEANRGLLAEQLYQCWLMVSGM